MGTVACIKVIYGQSELKLFKMIGVIIHICFGAGKGGVQGSFRLKAAADYGRHSKVVKRGKRQSHWGTGRESGSLHRFQV